jgi:uncharacterized protein (DUF362 family)
MKPQEGNRNPGITRRGLFVASGAVAGLAGAAALRESLRSHSSVFIARHQTYGGRLAQTIRDGLLSCGFAAAQFQGKRVLLKPNLVEPTRAVPHMTTHPAVILAAAEVFRLFGAEVIVGEAPGHVRDTLMALDESGVGEALRDGQLRFADLNYEDVAWRPNAAGYSKLKGLFFPRSVVEADFVVSMPKLKTHHWVGVTASMKNLYGVLPGIKYGWPKNVLHHHGIPETVVDIAASLPRTLAIVDGIDCMEGDGPILGSRKHLGLIIVGADLAATDATVARIMGLEPSRVTYLRLARQHFGPIEDRFIDQRGERWQEVASPFKLLDQPHLRQLLADRSGFLTS